MITCSLCGSHDLSNPLSKLNPLNIANHWQRKFNINIADELLGASEISLIECNTCGLKFFTPPVTGTGFFYSQLETFAWYYSDAKWEFKTALKDLRRGMSVLEVGCGRGQFVKMATNNHIDALGIEINEKAVLTAQKDGVNVQLKGLDDLVQGEPEQFDAVCAFQVLEHVANPGKFLSSCVALLRPGGMLIISVPNNDGFMKYTSSKLLDIPPHHISRWSKRTLHYATHLFPLKTHRTRYEPLAPNHIEMYINSQINRARMLLSPNIADDELGISAGSDSTSGLQIPTTINSLPAKTLRARLKRTLVLFIQKSGTNKLLQGHTIYISYKKLAK